jgi:hypothetical protein
VGWVTQVLHHPNEPTDAPLHLFDIDVATFARALAPALAEQRVPSH